MSTDKTPTAGTEPDLTTLECRVVDVAMALSRVAGEFDGDLTVCSEYLDALWAACDRIGERRAKLAGGFVYGRRSQAHMSDKPGTAELLPPLLDCETCGAEFCEDEPDAIVDDLVDLCPRCAEECREGFNEERLP